MPINPVMNGGIPAPIEGDDESSGLGFRAAVRAASDKSLGWTGISMAKGYLEGGPTVSKQDAEDSLKAQGYDASGVPDEGMSQGALLERMSRQSDIRQSEDIARRAHVGTTGQVAASIAGAVGDPINIALAPLASLTGVRAGLAVRAGVGATEGAALTGAYEKGQNILGKYEGDPDISTHQMMKDMMFGGALGGIMHSAFGPRPMTTPSRGPVTLDMIDRLGERTGAYSKATGVPVDQAVSRAGAIGRYQIEPATAAQYMGLNGKDSGVIASMRVRLRDPEFNKMVAGKVLHDLNKRFHNDPEAVAVAYNAGPGAARRFIRSGRDYSVLPQESREYAARISGVPRSVRVDAAKVATAQAESDSTTNVRPIVDLGTAENYRTNPFRLGDEHQDEVTRLETEAMQPKPGSVLTDDPDVKTRLSKMDEQAAAAAQTKETPVGQPAAIDPELAEHVTNDVQAAKDIQGRLGVAPDANEAEVTRGQYEEPEPHMIDGLPAEDHQKAVEAAVRCGLLKGGFSGA